ncbi:unnamed protein product [Withania somnifera]
MKNKSKKRRKVDVEDRSLDNITNYNGTDWEIDIKNMAEDIHFLLKAMVPILGSHGNAALLQFVLLLKSLRIRKLFMMLLLRVLKKEYASEKEEGEALNKIWDLNMEHMELITDARADLNKRRNRGNDELEKDKWKIEKLAKDEKQLVQCIEKLQEDLEKINKEASGELLKVAQKYSRIREPVYEERTNIIKDIPGFWFKAFLKHPILGGLVCTEEDHKIFEFLSSIKVEPSQDVKSGYTITFDFEPNVYFENTKLWKTYTFLEEDGRTEITGSAVQWAQGKGVDEQSFFRWFSEVDERDEIGEIIKDELWSDPLTCFHHEADEEGGDDRAVKDIEDEVVKDSDDEGQDDDND